MGHAIDESGVVVIRHPDGREDMDQLAHVIAMEVRKHLDARRPLVISVPKELHFDGDEWEIEFHTKSGRSWPYQVIRLSELVRE